MSWIDQNKLLVSSNINPEDMQLHLLFSCKLPLFLSPPPSFLLHCPYRISVFSSQFVLFDSDSHFFKHSARLWKTSQRFRLCDLKVCWSGPRTSGRERRNRADHRSE